MEDVHTEVKDDGSNYAEKTAKIETYGIAHEVGPLLDWQPISFEPQSPRELFTVTSPFK